MASKGSSSSPSIGNLDSKSVSASSTPEVTLRPRKQRLLSLKKRPASIRCALQEEADKKKLLDCVFVCGLCQDATNGKRMAFSREKYPVNYSLPSGIEELCFPDASTWTDLSSPSFCEDTYSLVLTSPSGARTFGYCRRITPEGADFSLPLAICILTRHRARGLFSKILAILTNQYGSFQDLPTVFAYLHSQPFPDRGHKVRVYVGSRTTEVERHPDLRLESAGMTSALTTEQLLTVLGAALREKRIVVIGDSLSDLSLFFDGLESLLEPLVWQHSVIPALSPQHLEFLEAPTPFLMGLLLQLDGKDDDDELIDAAEEWYKEELKPIVETDPQCMVVLLRTKGPSSLVLKRPRGSLALPKTLRTDLAHCLKALDKDRRKEGGDKRNSKRDAKGDLWFQQNKFLLLCEVMRAHFQTLFGNVGDFVLQESSAAGAGGPRHGTSRVFCVEEFVASHSGEDHHTFVEEVAQTAMFGEHVRRMVTRQDLESASFNERQRRMKKRWGPPDNVMVR